jgi:hypothetical protein
VKSSAGAADSKAFFQVDGRMPDQTGEPSKTQSGLSVLLNLFTHSAECVKWLISKAFLKCLARLFNERLWVSGFGRLNKDSLIDALTVTLPLNRRPHWESMANYIKSEVLAEAYTHLDIELFEDKAKLEVLRKELSNFFHERASFMFGGDVDIAVVFEEGSLRTKIIATGKVALIIGGAIGAYGGFRESVVSLANDAVALAQAANMEVIFRTKTPHCDRLRIEKRKGVFGRVASLLSELDAVAKEVEESQLPATPIKLKRVNETVDRLLTWDASVDKLFSKFEGPETEACVSEGLLTEVNKLHRNLPWHRELQQPTFRAQIATSEPTHAGQLAAASARYSATVKAIEKKLKARMTIAVAANDG